MDVSRTAIPAMEENSTNMVDYPLRFRSFLRPQVWGGRCLEDLAKHLPTEGTFGEAWEVSTHPSHVSEVSQGPHADQLLTDLWLDHQADFVGRHITVDHFPWLVKWLDCHQLLSVQVHPDDRLAATMLPPERGKTEAWVVLQASEQGRVYAGFRPGVDEAVLRRHLAEGTVAECLHSFRPQAGDCIFLPAGTVHAVGGGVLMAEVQQPSDATFRLFDWNRVCADGQPRQLHIEQALAAINWQQGPVSPVQPVLRRNDGHAKVEQLVRCEFFGIDRSILNGHLTPAQQGQLCTLVVVSGHMRLTQQGVERAEELVAGDTLVVPAATPRWSLTSTGPKPAVFLTVFLPTAK